MSHVREGGRRLLVLILQLNDVRPAKHAVLLVLPSPPHSLSPSPHVISFVDVRHFSLCGLFSFIKKDFLIVFYDCHWHKDEYSQAAPSDFKRNVNSFTASKSILGSWHCLGKVSSDSSRLWQWLSLLQLSCPDIKQETRRGSDDQAWPLYEENKLTPTPFGNDLCPHGQPGKAGV